MKPAAFITGLIFICCELTEQPTAEVQLEGFAETAVQWQCRDRYLWIHVASGQTTRFEAVDGNDIHSISEQLASRCGYTISIFKMDGFTTFRASYYSCFTHNQNDETFTFKFNVMVSDAGGGWISSPVSAICSGLIWTHREIICEEDYMEVNVNRESSCGGQVGDGGQVWQAAFHQALRTARGFWQLMVLQGDGQVSSMSVSEAQRRGYSLTTTAQRVVLRSRYKQPHAEMTTVDGIPVEIIRASLFFRQKLTVVMIDVSVACTVNLGSFDGVRLLWDVPRVLSPLVGGGAGFESRSLSVGVEGVLLDKAAAAARGFSLVQQGNLIQIAVPFGAEGGYRKSWVVNNAYKETYVIDLLYEHIFSLLYEDGGSIDTRHRMLRVLDTPPHCRPPFSLNQTVSGDQVFSVYLGNIPADVVLEEVRINGQQLMMSESAERGYGISPVVHANGSRAYGLRLPFEDVVVHWMYLGHGVLQYSIDINFTLTIVPQRDSYHHHTSVTARVFNAFPPEITARCSDGGITFSVVRPPRAETLWEVGVDHEPLTPQLAAQRGYHLHSDTRRTTLEVPLFSIGYIYEDINLSNFYGTFKLLLRDSKTLQVQASTSKRCLFKTQDMTVCSADGTMTVVTSPAATWPTVQPERTTLLDPTCRPKQADGSRVLFEFKLSSCGTRAMVGTDLVYENEILHDRQMIADGPNFISRESQFKLTVRCFYPLSGINRLSANSVFRSGTPGFGSVDVFKNLKDSAKDCSHQVSGHAANIPTDQVHQTPAPGGVLPYSGIRPQLKPGPSLITVPGRYIKLLYSSQNLQTFPNLNLLPLPELPPIGTHQVPLQVSSNPGLLLSQTQDQHVFRSPTGDHLLNLPPRYDQLPVNSIQLTNLNTPSLKFVEERRENSGLTDENPGSSSSSRIPDSPVDEQLETNWGSSSQTRTLEGPNSDNVWYSGLTWDQPTLSQNGIITPDQDLQSLKVYLSPGMKELTQQHEASLDLSHYGSSGVGMEMASTEIPGYQPQSPHGPSQTSHLVLQPPAHYNPVHIGSSEQVQPRSDKKPVPATKHITAKTSDSSGYTQGSVSPDPTATATSPVDQNLGRPGSIERRNIETVQSRVQNIRVKPQGKFVSSGHLETPFTQQGHQPRLVQSVAETGNNGGQESVSTWRNSIHPTGTSLIRDRLVPGLPGRLHTSDKPKLQNLQNPTTQSDSRGGTSRNTYLSFSPQQIPNSPDNVREHQPNGPTAGGAGLTGAHTDSIGSGGSGSDLRIHTRSDSGGWYGASVHQGIMRANVRSVRDALCVSGPDLQRLTGLSRSDTQQLLAAAATACRRHPPIPALLLRGGESGLRLSVSCPVLDQLLRGGLPVGGVTELAGESGAGKTQLALQLCLSAQYPTEHGGLDSGAVYICTEDTFPIRRLQQLISGQSCLRPDVPPSLISSLRFSDHVYIEHAADLDSLQVCLSRRVPLLLARGLVRLLVVDSVAALFRSEFQAADWLERSKQLLTFSSTLHHLSQEFTTPVLCINQVTDVFSSSDHSLGPLSSNVAPALGLAWANQVTVRLMMRRLQGTVARGDQHSALRRLEVAFAPHLARDGRDAGVWREGVRGVLNPDS